MTVTRLAFTVLLAALLASLTGLAAATGDRSVFPFVKGTTWTYAGFVRWTDPPHAVRSKNNVRWSCQVVDAFDHGDVAAALLLGGVWDLGGWSPAAPKRSHVVLRVRTRYYRVFDDAERTFAAVKRSGRAALPQNLAQTVWFDSPLKQGEVYRPPDFGPRDDTWYGWWVERVSSARLRLAGATAPTRPEYLLTYVTLASTERMTMVPGVGVTSFEYLHDGTAAEAHLRLVAYRRGSAR